VGEECTGGERCSFIDIGLNSAWPDAKEDDEWDRLFVNKTRPP